MKFTEIVEKEIANGMVGSYRPTVVDGNNCNLTQAIQTSLEARYPGESEIALAAWELTDTVKCSECKSCPRGVF